MLVEWWLRSTTDAADEGGCHIGQRHYEGRAGEQVSIREDGAQMLAAAGYVQRVADQQAWTPAAGFIKTAIGQP